MNESNEKKCLYKRLYEDLKSQIENGQLGAGSQLPSLRQLAADLGVSRITVSHAYRKLELEGLIETRERQGTFVAGEPSSPPCFAQHEVEIEQHALNQFWDEHLNKIANPERNAVLNEIHKSMSGRNVIPFCQGGGDTSLFPVQNFRIIINRILRVHGHTALGAGCTEGSQELRVVVAEYLNRLGIQVSHEGLVLTSGSQQAVALVADALLEKGDRVVVESPGWPAAMEAFSERGVQLVSVPLDQDGMQIDALDAVLKNHRPQLIYTAPTFHNPTGSVMSLERRKALIERAQRYDIPVLEDDNLREIHFGLSAPPPIAALDHSGHVIHIGSFTKSLFPAARVGYLVAPEQLLESALARKRWMDRYCSPLLHYTLAAYLQSCEAVSFWKRINRVYARRQDCMSEALKHYFPEQTRWRKVHGGPCLWVEAPQDVSVRDLFHRASRNGITFAPGEVFFPTPDNQPYLRLNFAAVDEKTIETGIRKLSGLLAPARSMPG